MGELRVIENPSLLDIPARLRKLAGEIESGEMAAAMTAVVVIGQTDGRVAVYGFGQRSSGLETTGWLYRALTSITEGAGSDEGTGGSWPPAA